MATEAEYKHTQRQNNCFILFIVSLSLLNIGQWKTNRKVEGVQKAIRSDHDPWLNLNSGPHCDKSF